MADTETDIKADMDTAGTGPADREEQVSLMEPMRIPYGSPRREGLTDLALELVAGSAGFRRSLPEGVLAALADLVRSMNCYYSNLIEGHDTHPVDIERALQDDYSQNRDKRNLQLEARAHIEVQRWIDAGGLRGKATTADGLCEIHRRFGELLPADLLLVEDPDTGETLEMTPGELRRCEVKVGRHVPVSPGSIPRFLERFEGVYSSLGKSEAILAAAAAHHRLLWIHPFLNGNGRIARLMSHATLLDVLDTGGVWSVARGLARNVRAYKGHLMACDQRRRNDLDGRGNLSEEELASFTNFFLKTCLDQVGFMEELVQPDGLRSRILLWAEEEHRGGRLPDRAGAILEAVLYRGELPRGDAAGIVGTSDRQARRIVSALLQAGVLTSESTRGPLRLAFPAKLAPRWMPGLFPEESY